MGIHLPLFDQCSMFAIHYEDSNSQGRGTHVPISFGNSACNLQCSSQKQHKLHLFCLEPQTFVGCEIMFNSRAISDQLLGDAGREGGGKRGVCPSITTSGITALVQSGAVPACSRRSSERGTRFSLRITTKRRQLSSTNEMLAGSIGPFGSVVVRYCCQTAKALRPSCRSYHTLRQ